MMWTDSILQQCSEEYVLHDQQHDDGLQEGQLQQGLQVFDHGVLQRQGDADETEHAAHSAGELDDDRCEQQRLVAYIMHLEHIAVCCCLYQYSDGSDDDELHQPHVTEGEEARRVRSAPSVEQSELPGVELHAYKDILLVADEQ